MKKIQCECDDPGCKEEHEGQCKRLAHVALKRTDFAGQPTCYFCRACADDALESGVFA